MCFFVLSFTGILFTFQICQWRSYIYAKTHLRTHFDKNMGRFYHNSDGLLMLCVQNVCLEPILISQNQILTEFVTMSVSPFDDLSPINAK